MTTTSTHAAPWTFRRFLAMFTGQPTPRRRANRPGVTHILTGREATARHLFGESVHWSALDMLEYDNSPILQGGWLAEADRRIRAAAHPERYIAALHGYTPEQWDSLPAIVRADLRETVVHADRFRA